MADHSAVESSAPSSKRRPLARTRRYLVAGVLTLIPIWITWLVFEFLLRQLSNIGMPWVRALAAAVQEDTPFLARWLLEPWFQSALAAVTTVFAIYLIGWAATRVFGRRLIGMVESLIDRIPFVQTIYGGTKKLLLALQQKPENVQRVVLIAFPSPDMKAVGFVTRVLKDEKTGAQLAAVYVPTTPNPTSGYLEVVPVEQLVSTDWSMDEAMSFIISGGAIAPDTLNYGNSAQDKTQAAER